MTDHLRRLEEDVLPSEVRRTLDAAIRNIEDGVRILIAGEVAKAISECTGLRGMVFHESGHAVLGCLLGRLLTSIEFRCLEPRGLRGTGFLGSLTAQPHIKVTR